MLCLLLQGQQLLSELVYQADFATGVVLQD